MAEGSFQGVEAFLQRVPYVRFLGMRVELAGDGQRFRLEVDDWARAGEIVTNFLPTALCGILLMVLAPAIGHLRRRSG